ncbi:MAG TPA: alkaline phosphatase family protein [Blastococcus sp.]|nr:alkaline phosphatase family protein [Blastococcus sp.]
MAVTAAALAVTAPGSAVASPGYRGDDSRGSNAFDHILVSMLENHSKSSVIDDANAPYLTSLAHTYAMADHYYGVTHPSMPNYIASIGGDNFGVQDHNDQNIVNLDRKNLVDQLEAKKVRWGAYMKASRPTRPPASGTRSTARRRSCTPRSTTRFVLFDDVKDNPARMDKVRDYMLTAIEANWNLGHLGHAGDTGDTAGGVVPMWASFVGPHGRR